MNGSFIDLRIIVLTIVLVLGAGVGLAYGTSTIIERSKKSKRAKGAQHGKPLRTAATISIVTFLAGVLAVAIERLNPRFVDPLYVLAAVCFTVCFTAVLNLILLMLRRRK